MTPTSDRPFAHRWPTAAACLASVVACMALTSGPVAAAPLNDSDPIEVLGGNDVVIEDVRIRTGKNERCAIRIENARNVTIRRAELLHANIGICAQDVENLVIEQVKLTSESTPEAGPHCEHGVAGCKDNSGQWADPDTRLSLRLLRTPGVKIDRIQIEGSSGGVFSYQSPGTEITDIVCMDIRGPYPRAQCVQFVSSNDSLVDGFYSKIWKDVSRSEDNINLYDSDRVTVRNGLIDGNYSINGVGVIADHGSDDAVVQDIDIIHTSVSAVSVWSNDASTVGKNFLAERIRVKDTQCESRGGDKPSSQGLVFAAHPDANNFRFLDTQYYNHCRDLTFFCSPGGSCRKSGSGTVDLREEDFTPRAPLQLTFPWEDNRPTIIDISVQ